MWEALFQFIRSRRSNVMPKTKSKPRTTQTPHRKQRLRRLKKSSNFSCVRKKDVAITFQRYGALQNHILYGSHNKKQEKITLIDRAKKGYARRLEIQYGAVPSKTSACNFLEEENDTVSGMGWALPQQKAKSKFNDKQKQYLGKKFEEGEITGRKLKADEVAQDMRRAKDEMGK